MNNRALACHLRAHAAQLKQEETSLYRIRAYRRAADTIEAWPRSLAEIFREGGRAALQAIPDVGEHLGYTLEGLLTTGVFRTLRLDDAHQEPDRRLTSLPGIGVHLALRLHEQLGISTLEDLERAARAGRLNEVGIGPRRLQTLLAALEERRRQASRRDEEPSVAELLRLDANYRHQTQQQQLPRTWQGEQGNYRYHIDFCRRPLAQRLGRTRDWVIIRFGDGERDRERLVVTETRGDLAGQRVVRGREQECRQYYQATAEPVLTA